MNLIDAVFIVAAFAALGVASAFLLDLLNNWPRGLRSAGRRDERYPPPR
jgi:hypothetical protein